MSLKSPGANELNPALLRIKSQAPFPPNSKVYGANMEPTWGQQDPGGPHVGPTNLAIWAHTSFLWMTYGMSILSILDRIYAV